MVQNPLHIYNLVSILFSNFKSVCSIVHKSLYEKKSFKPTSLTKVWLKSFSYTYPRGKSADAKSGGGCVLHLHLCGQDVVQKCSCGRKRPSLRQKIKSTFIETKKFEHSYKEELIWKPQQQQKASKATNVDDHRIETVVEKKKLNLSKSSLFSR